MEIFGAEEKFLPFVKGSPGEPQIMGLCGSREEKETQFEKRNPQKNLKFEGIIGPKYIYLKKKREKKKNPLWRLSEMMNVIVSKCFECWFTWAWKSVCALSIIYNYIFKGKI